MNAENKPVFVDTNEGYILIIDSDLVLTRDRSPRAALAALRITHAGEVLHQSRPGDPAFALFYGSPHGRHAVSVVRDTNGRPLKIVIDLRNLNEDDERHRSI